MKYLLSLTFLFSISSFAAEPSDVDLSQLCRTQMGLFSKATDKNIVEACAKVKVKDGCRSVKGTPIYHYDRLSSRAESSQNVLVLSLIHGDETHAGTVSKLWMDRLEAMDPRNNWRVIPMVNPDGFAAKTRTNANNVDINRNFPTKDWEAQALKLWKSQTSSNPRRFPGEKSASEPETLCVLSHMEEYKPDFVISVHTPLRVLDFDGPKVAYPKYDYLPWKSLGHFPGSLGRYLWFERSTPVLTMELKESLPAKLETFNKLQDLIGTMVDLEMGKKPMKTVSFQEHN